MNEAELKRALVKSIRAQGGIGERIEDKYKVGWPDLILIPEDGPVFFAEAKLVEGVRHRGWPSPRRRPTSCTSSPGRRIASARSLVTMP